MGIKFGTADVALSALFKRILKGETSVFESFNGIDAYVVSMLHLNGAGSKTITDSAKTRTITNNTALTSSQKKFGDASYGTGQASMSDSADFDFGTADFTIDFWGKRTNTFTQSKFFYCAYSGDKFDFGIYSGGQWSFVSEYGYSNIVSFYTNASVSDTNWHHFALVRSTSLGWFMFLDGQSKALTSVPNKNANIRRVNGTYYFCDAAMYMDEFRISKGIARWTADFTPPTKEYS
jgi:hypothetical protein